MQGEAESDPLITEAQPAGRREWIGLAVIALPCLLYSMDLSVLYLAVPSLSADLEPTSSQLLWITDIYGFFLAGFLITMGTLGDRIGRRRLLLLGAAAFGVASVFAAFSTSVAMLIVSRALLGIAAATLAPSTLSLIRNMFLDPGQRTFAIGIWATSFSVGAAIGPLFGGLLLQFFWWGSVFLLAVPVMALLLVLGPRLLPEFRNPDAGRLDLASAGLSVVAVLAVIYGLKRMAESGLDGSALLSIAAGFAVALFFIRRQHRIADPLVDLSLFRSRRFNAALASNTLSLAIAFGIFLFIAQYLQLVLGLSPLEAGLWTVPSAGGFIAGSMLAPLVVRHVRPAYVVAGGLVLAATGLGLLTQVDGDSELAVIVVGSVVIALGIAVLGSIGVAIYRNQMDDSLPSGLPSEQVEAAEDTLGGALQVAEGLGGESGATVLAAAQEAFAVGMQVAAVAGAAVALSTAVFVARFLRRTGTGPQQESALMEASP
jgi:DHA2 family multidrug resistance protein-like MFS transporter